MRLFVAPVLVAAVGLTTLAGAASGQSAGSTPEEQLRALGRARDLALESEADPAPARMETVRAALDRPARVQLGRGTIELPPDPFLAELDGTSAEDFADAAERLGRLAEELRAAAGSESIDPDALAVALEDAYREVRARPTLAQRLWRFAEDLLTRFVEALAGAGEGLGVAAAIVLGLLAAAGVWLLGRRLLVVADEHAPIHRPTTERPADWRREADAALAAGDLERAVRAQYRLLIHQLARRGLIRDTPSLTPAEARRAVAGAPRGVDDAVREAIAVFERMAYGAIPPERVEVERMRTAVEAAAP